MKNRASNFPCTLTYGTLFLSSCTARFVFDTRKKDGHHQEYSTGNNVSTIGMTDKYREYIKFANENCSHFPLLMNYKYFCYIKLISCSVNLVPVSLKLTLWHKSFCLLLGLIK